MLRCIFVGHVRTEKGVLDAIAAVRQLERAELHIYGPLVDVDAEQLAAPRVFYHGALRPEHVQAALAEADVLLFPTYYSGEGYPGTLVEAALVGLPVVATDWQAIPEMFPAEEVVFVKPRSAAEITAALQEILERRMDLNALSERMRARSSDFDAATVFGRFEAMCARVSSGHNKQRVR